MSEKIVQLNEEVIGRLRSWCEEVWRKHSMNYWRQRRRN